MVDIILTSMPITHWANILEKDMGLIFAFYTGTVKHIIEHNIYIFYFIIAILLAGKLLARQCS